MYHIYSDPRYILPNTQGSSKITGSRAVTVSDPEMFLQVTTFACRFLPSMWKDIRRSSEEITEPPQKKTKKRHPTDVSHQKKHQKKTQIGREILSSLWNVFQFLFEMVFFETWLSLYSIFFAAFIGVTNLREIHWSSLHLEGMKDDLGPQKTQW